MLQCYLGESSGHKHKHENLDGNWDSKSKVETESMAGKWRS